MYNSKVEHDLYVQYFKHFESIFDSEVSEKKFRQI